MEIGLNIAVILVSFALIGLVILQGRNVGMQNNGGAMNHTKRGLEKTLHQTTIVVAVVFLILSLIASLPLF